MIKEFKDFISKGNVVDLAVGVIIGSAFGKIVSSLVDNILMPVIGLLIGGVDFSSLSIKVKDATIGYGMFIQNVIDFLIIALCVFMFVKAINKITNLRKAEEEKNEEIKETELSVLKEIREELKKDKHKTTKK